MHGLDGPVGVCRSGFERIAALAVLPVIAVICVATPAEAQTNTHGGGIGWSGSHGGVSWDGRHAYSGGGYSGFPPAYRPVPPLRPTAVHDDRVHASRTATARPVDPEVILPRPPVAMKTREKR